MAALSRSFAVWPRRLRDADGRPDATAPAVTVSRRCDPGPGPPSLSSCWRRSRSCRGLRRLVLLAATASNRSRRRRSSKRPKPRPRPPPRCTSGLDRHAKASRSRSTWNCSRGKGGKGTISQEGFTIQLIQTGGAVYINGSAAFYKHVGGLGRGGAAPGQMAEGPRQQRRTGLARRAHEPRQADRHRARRPRHRHQGRHHDGRRPEGRRTEGHDQGRHALRRRDGQALPAADHEERAPKAARSSSTAGISRSRWKRPQNAIDISALQKGG